MPAHTLVMYHYYESKRYAENLIYFLNHGIHPDVDYVILISGGCSMPLPIAGNIRYIHTKNQGLDFGAYATGLSVIDLNDYFYFVFVNCTTRGPFMLDRDDDDWTKFFTGRIDRTVKLVGTTVNTLPGGNIHADGYVAFSGRKPPFPHVQTMAFAIDRICLTLLLKEGFFSEVPDAKVDVIIRFEVHLSQLVLAQGWNIACLAPDGYGVDFRKVAAGADTKLQMGDRWYPGAYYGRSLHPYETVFFKNNRDVRPPEEIDSLSRSQRTRGLSRDTALPIERTLANIATAWGGHKLFARWLVGRMRARVVVDLGVDLGFSSLCFASVGGVDVYGIDSFQGDDHIGQRNTYDAVMKTVADLALTKVHIIKGFFSDVASTWERSIDILHVDGRHDYDSVREDHLTWKTFVRKGGIILFHDTCVSHFGVRRYFEEIETPKLNFLHSFGLGVTSQDGELISEIAALFSGLVEPGSLRI